MHSNCQHHVHQQKRLTLNINVRHLFKPFSVISLSLLMETNASRTFKKHALNQNTALTTSCWYQSNDKTELQMLDQSDVRDVNTQHWTSIMMRRAAAQTQHWNIVNTLTLTSARAGGCVSVCISLCQSCCCCCCCFSSRVRFFSCCFNAPLKAKSLWQTRAASADGYGASFAYVGGASHLKVTTSVTTWLTATN